MYVIRSMIETLIATGLAGALTVLVYINKRSRYNHNDERERVENRIKERVISVWKEYKEHGIIDEEEYIYLHSLNDHYIPSRYSVNDQNKNKYFILSIIRRLDSIEGRFDLLDRSLREYMDNMNRYHTIDKTNKPYVKRIKRMVKRPRVEYEYKTSDAEGPSILSYEGDKDKLDDLEEIKRRINDMIKRLDSE